AERFLTAYEKAKGQTAESLLEWTLLGVQQGDFAGQGRALQVMVNEDHPDSALILEALANGYYNTHDATFMLHCLDLLLESESNHAPALLLRARGLEGQHRPLEEVLAAYERALQLSPDSVEARLGLAEALNRL